MFCPMTTYAYPISARFKPLNKKMKAALESGKTVRVKTTLSLPECVYYLDQLIYNTTVLRYATYHAYKTLKETDAIRLKQGKTYCVYTVDGKALAPLVAEAKANRELVDKAIRSLGIRKTVTVRTAIKDVSDYLYYIVPSNRQPRWANDLLTKKGGNCAAHSAAFKAFMVQIGIPCEFLIGNIDEGCHAWNRVKIDGKWWYIDVTYDMHLSETLWKNYYEITERF